MCERCITTLVRVGSNSTLSSLGAHAAAPPSIALPVQADVARASVVFVSAAVKVARPRHGGRPGAALSSFALTLPKSADPEKRRLLEGVPLASCA